MLDRIELKLTRCFPHELHTIDDLDVARPGGSIQRADGLDEHAAKQRVLLLEAIEIPVELNVVKFRRGHSHGGCNEKTQYHYFVHLLCLIQRVNR